MLINKVKTFKLISDFSDLTRRVNLALIILLFIYPFRHWVSVNLCFKNVSTTKSQNINLSDKNISFIIP